jgi:drug/metabolite transporter (DMT)-like permease
MFPVTSLGILSALASALVWGGGDFCGGLATRRTSLFAVLTYAALSGLGLLLLLALLTGEPLPAAASLGWAVLAGTCGTLGLALFYRALATGNAALVAPTAAVLGAGIPVIFSALTFGLPPLTQVLGFIIALVGIGLMGRSAIGERHSRSAFVLALLSGLGFAAFFILIARVERGSVLFPLVISRSTMLIISLILLRARGEQLPAPSVSGVALLSGVLDAGGNLFYLLAQQLTRLDIAVVLSSLYPAITILLSRLILKERATRAQWCGAALCLAAVPLITL